MQNKRLQSLIAGATLFFYAAQGTPLLAAVPVAQRTAAGDIQPAALALGLELPPELGRIESLFSPQSGAPFVFHIQEAHGNPEIQKKIAGILDYLQHRYGMTTVFTEGSAFKMEPRLMRFFSRKPEWDQKIAQNLLQNSLAGGPELFLFSKAGTQGYGIEKADIYKQNREAFRAVLEERERSAAFLAAMNLQVERLSAPYLSRPLKDFLKQSELFEEGLLPLESRLEAFRKQARKYLNLQLESPLAQTDWPMLTRTLALKRLEGEIRRENFEKERPEFLEAVLHFVGRQNAPDGRPYAEALRAMLAGSIGGQKLPDPQTGLFFEALFAALPQNFNTRRFPETLKFLGSLILQSELDGRALQEELSRMEDLIAGKLCATAAERKVVALYKDHARLKSLFRLELAPPDYARFAGKENELLPSRLARKFLELNPEQRVRDTHFEHLDALDRLYRAALDFYRLAKERDQLMIAKTRRLLKKHALKTAAVVTGGFHAEPFREQLTRQGIGYALITPALSDAHPRDSYVHKILQTTGAPAAALKDIPYAQTLPGRQRLLGVEPLIPAAEIAASVYTISAPALGSAEANRRLNASRFFSAIPGEEKVTSSGPGATRVQFNAEKGGPLVELDAQGNMTSAERLSGFWPPAAVGKLRRSETRNDISIPDPAWIAGMQQEFEARQTAVWDGSESAETKMAAAAELVDETVKAVYAKASGLEEFREQVQNLALVAMGSYGRRELTPGSDRDGAIFFRGEHEPSGAVKFIYSALNDILRAQWTYVPVSEEIETLKGVHDFISAIELLDARTVAGNPEFFEQDRLRFLAEHHENDEFLDAIIAKWSEQYKNTGYLDGLYAREPDLKGALRHYQYARWAAQAFTADLNEPFRALERRGLLLDDEVKDARRAYELVLKIRMALPQAQAGKGIIVPLAFEAQDQTAENLGYTGDSGRSLSARERMLSDYYEAALTLFRFSYNILRRLSETSRPPLEEVLEELPDLSVRVVKRSGRLFRVETGFGAVPSEKAETYLDWAGADPALTAQLAPEQVMPLFRLALERKAYFTGALLNVLENSQPAFAKKVKADAGFANRSQKKLLKLLESQAEISYVLLRMHFFGYLKLLLPAFGGLEALVKTDILNRTTLDRHALNAVALADTLLFARAAEGANEQLRTDFAQVLAPLHHPENAGSLRNFRLALLYEPLEQLLPGLSTAAIRHLNLKRSDKQSVLELLRKREALITLMRRQGLYDTAAFPRFVRTVVRGDAGLWRTLLLLTLVRVQFFQPQQAWLYARELADARDLTEKELSDPAALLAWIRAKEAARLPLLAQGDDVVIRPIILPDDSSRLFAEVTVRQKIPTDRPGVLAGIAGVFTANRLEVLSAEIENTGPSDQVADRFIVRVLDFTGGELNTQSEFWQDLDSQLTADFRDFFENQTSTSELFRRRRVPYTFAKSPGYFKPASEVPTQIFFHKQAEFTWVKIETADRPGLLHILSRVFKELDINILAHSTVDTEGYDKRVGLRAVDTFSLQFGGRPLELAVRKKLVKALRAVLNSEAVTEATFQQLRRSEMPPGDPGTTRDAKRSSRSVSGPSLDEAGPEQSLPPARAEMRANLARHLEPWMGHPETLRAFQEDVVEKKPYAREDLQILFAMIETKLDQLKGVDELEAAYAVTGALRKAEIIAFDELRFAESKTKTRFLAAAIEGAEAEGVKAKIYFGQGLREDTEFGSQMLWRLGAKLVRASGTVLPEGITQKLFGTEADFQERLREFAELSDPAFLKSAVARFSYFWPGAHYFNTVNLVEDWVRFMVAEDEETPQQKKLKLRRARETDLGDEVPDEEIQHREIYHPVAGQAGFLVQKMIPSLEDGALARDMLTNAKFLSIAMPYFLFVIYRHAAISALSSVWESKHAALKQQAEEAVRTFTWIQEQLKRDASGRSLPGVMVNKEVMDIVAKRYRDFRDEAPAQSVWKNSRVPPDNPERLINAVYKEMVERLHETLARKETPYEVLPHFALELAFPELLTPETGKRLLTQHENIGVQLFRHPRVLERALKEYAGHDSKDEPVLYFDGFGPASDPDNGMVQTMYRLLTLYSGVRSEEYFSHPVSIQSEDGAMVGLTQIRAEETRMLSEGASPVEFRIIRGGGNAVSMRKGPSKRPYYGVSGAGILHAFVYENSLRMDLISWLNFKGAEREYPLQLAPWKARYGDFYAALMQIRGWLSRTPALKDTYYSPGGADVAAWADRIALLRDDVDTAYWRVLYAVRSDLDVFTDEVKAQEHFPLAHAVYLHALFNGPGSLMKKLADELQLEPDGRRLTRESVTAVLDLLAAVYWAGPAREDRIDGTLLILMTEFRRRLRFHPDGMSIDDLEEFKRFLRGADPAPPFARLTIEDLQQGETSPAFRRWEEFYVQATLDSALIEPTHAEIPALETGSDAAAFAHVRPQSQPAYYDGELIPKDNLLHPERWPQGSKEAGPYVAEWLARYPEGGLILPGSTSVFLLDPRRIHAGGLVRVVVSEIQDEEGILVKRVRIVPARSETRDLTDYESLEAFMAEGFEDADVAAKVAAGKKIADVVKTKLIAIIKQWIMDMPVQQFRPVGVGFLRHLEQAELVHFPEEFIEDAASGSGRAVLAGADKRRIGIAEGLLNPRYEKLAAAMLLAAVVEHSRKVDKPWDDEDYADVPKIAGFILEKEKEALLADRQEFLDKHFYLLDVTLETALSPRGARGESWHKLPQTEALGTLYHLEDAEDGVSPDAFEFPAAGADRVATITGDGAYLKQAGPDGFLKFGLNGDHLALNLQGQGAKTILIHVSQSRAMLDFYVWDAEKMKPVEFIGTVQHEAANVSSTPEMEVLPRLPASVAHHPIPSYKTYLQYERLAMALKPLMEKGRGYTSIRIRPAEQQAAVYLDLQAGLVYLPERFLELGSAEAAQEFREALQRSDPVEQLQSVYERMLAFIENGKEFEPALVLPDVPELESENAISGWVNHNYYRDLHARTVNLHARLVLMRKLNAYHSEIPRQVRDKFSLPKFQASLREAAAAAFQGKYFLYAQGGGSGYQTATGQAGGSTTASIKELTIPDQHIVAGVGVALAGAFKPTADGYQLSASFVPPPDQANPLRYLFIRYQDFSKTKTKTATVKVFSLETGEEIEQHILERQELAASVEAARLALLAAADRQKTRMNFQRLESVFDEFLGRFHFSQAFQASHSGDDLDKLRLEIQQGVLTRLKQFLNPALNSEDYDDEENFAVLEMILADVLKEGAEHALGRVKRLNDDLAGAEESHLYYLHAYLSDVPDYARLDPKAGHTAAFSDFVQRVLLPYARYPDADARAGMSNPEFMSLLLDSTVPAIRLQIAQQVEKFVARLPAQKLKNGVFSLRHEFLNGVYEPVAFFGKPAANRMTSIEEFFVDEALRREEDKKRVIQDEAEISRRATHLTLFGAAEGIGASSMQVTYQDESILVDAGQMIKTGDAPKWPSAFSPGLQAVFLTHTHIDHVGAAVKLWRDLKGKVPFYVTPGTYSLLRMVLGFSIGLNAGTQVRFTEGELNAFMEDVHVLEPNEWVAVSPNMKVYLHGPVGHLHGATSLVVSTPDSNTLITSDISFNPQDPVPGWAALPPEIASRIDRVVIEGTYGMRERKPEAEEIEKLIKAVGERLHARGKVLFPAFANGRSQRVLMTLLKNWKKLVEQGGSDIQILLDGQASAFTQKILREYPEVFKPYRSILQNHVHFIPEERGTAWLKREEVLLDDSRPNRRWIIISSSGNATEGMSNWWAFKMVSDPANGIYFTGYMDPQEALGSQLLETAEYNRDTKHKVKRKQNFQGVVLEIFSQVDKFNLSGHISGPEMVVHVLEPIGPSLREVVIQHADERQRYEIWKWIKDHHPEWGPVTVKTGEIRQGPVPLTQEALNDRRDFFNSLDAKQLDTQAFRAVAESKVPADAPDDAPEPMQSFSMMDVPEMAIGQLVVESDVLVIGETPATVSEVVPDPAASSVVEPSKPAPKARKPSKTVFEKIAAAKTIFNAVPKLTNPELLSLARYVVGKDKISGGDPEKTYSVTAKALERIEQELQTRGLQRSELRHAGDWQEGLRVRIQILNIPFVPYRLQSRGAGFIRQALALFGLSETQAKPALPALPKAFVGLTQVEQVWQETQRSETPRQVIDVRDALPQPKEILALLPFLTGASPMRYVLLTPAGEAALKSFKIELQKLIDREKLFGLPSGLRLETLEREGRLNFESLDSAQAASSAINRWVLSGKQKNVRSALVSADAELIKTAAADAKRYRFLSLKVPDRKMQTAAVPFAAGLLDKITDEMLARSSDTFQNALSGTLWESFAAQIASLRATSSAA